MDELARRVIIRQRLDDGELPTQSPARLWAGYGAGESCDGCGQTIAAQDVMYELAFTTVSARKSYCFHQRCSELWKMECAGRAARAPAARGRRPGPTPVLGR